MTEQSEARPLQPIRRFDVFAETKRLEALAHGEPDDVAKGYGIRIAKIVASKRFGGSAGKKTHHEQTDASERESPTESRFRGEVGGKFRALDGEIQSDETFDREIVDRMGPEFYEAVSNRPSVKRWPLVGSTSSSGTPFAKTGSWFGADWGGRLASIDGDRCGAAPVESAVAFEPLESLPQAPFGAPRRTFHAAPAGERGGPRAKSTCRQTPAINPPTIGPTQ